MTENNLKRRIDRIERKLEPVKGNWLKFPDGEGGFIEVSGCRTLADMLVLAGIRKCEQATVRFSSPTKKLPRSAVSLLANSRGRLMSCCELV